MKKGITVSKDQVNVTIEGRISTVLNKVATRAADH